MHQNPNWLTLCVKTTVFPVTIYGGTKSIVLSTRTVMGGKNPFMGIAYVVVGGICVVLGAVFTFAHLVKPRYDFFGVNPPFLLERESDFCSIGNLETIPT